jgi:hypothetical protein
VYQLCLQLHQTQTLFDQNISAGQRLLQLQCASESRKCSLSMATHLRILSEQNRTIGQADSMSTKPVNAQLHGCRLFHPVQLQPSKNHIFDVGVCDYVFPVSGSVRLVCAQAIYQVGWKPTKREWRRCRSDLRWAGFDLRMCSGGQWAVGQHGSERAGADEGGWGWGGFTSIIKSTIRYFISYFITYIYDHVPKVPVCRGLGSIASTHSYPDKNPPCHDSMSLSSPFFNLFSFFLFFFFRF